MLPYSWAYELLFFLLRFIALMVYSVYRISREIVPATNLHERLHYYISDTGLQVFNYI